MSSDFNTPTAMAESMLKRFLQFKRALPSDDNRKVFRLILDNRYKLLGNLVPNSARNELIERSFNSLSLLTLHTMAAEDSAFSLSLKNNHSTLKEVLSDIFVVISKEVEKETPFDVQLEQALKLYS